MRGKAVIVLVCVAFLGSAPYPPDMFSGVRLVEAPDGIGFIVWENTTGADSVVVLNLDSICPYPVVKAIDPALVHVLTQVPEGPPYEGRCLLRSGDRLYMQRYLGGFFVDQEGPFVVARHVWLPMVGGSP